MENSKTGKALWKALAEEEEERTEGIAQMTQISSEKNLEAGKFNINKMIDFEILRLMLRILKAYKAVREDDMYGEFLKYLPKQ